MHKKVLLFWLNHQDLSSESIANEPLSSKQSKTNVAVEWEKYHFINSKKWIIEDLLSEVGFTEINSLKNLEKKKVIIITSKIVENFNKLEKICSSNEVILVHLGNEFLNNMEKNIEIYKKCYCVLRPYFFFSNLKNICHIPVGYKKSNKFYKEKKKFTWSFIGTIYKSSRNDLIEVFKEKFNNFYFHKTDYFNDKKSLSSDEMYKIISESVFSPCPQGFYHPETYRVFEVLENNSIPILLDHNNFFEKIFPNNNLIKVKYWKEFIKKYDQINTEESLELNLKWYFNYKNNLKLKIKNIIHG